MVAIPSHVENEQGWLSNPVVRAYRGDSITNLALVPTAFSSRINLRATGGEMIRLQVLDTQFSASRGLLKIRPASPNDDFENALIITNALTTGTTLGASSEPNEMNEQTVWYKWQPEATGGYDVSLITQSGSHALYVYEGASLLTLTLLHRIQHPPVEESSTSIFADASKIYYIAVNGLSPWSEGFQIRITPGPANDAFAGRANIAEVGQYFDANTQGATREPGEPSHNVTTHSRTLWYEWSAPSTGGFYLEVWTRDPTPVFAIYQGDTVSNLVAIPSETFFDSTAFSYGRLTTFRAVAGEKYAIVLADHLFRTSRFRIQHGVAHDDFENALDLPFDTEVQYPSMGATMQPGEPIQRLETTATVWHRFTAPTNSTYVALATGGFPSVYRGTALTNLSLTDPASTNIAMQVFPFRAAVGETVYISMQVTPPARYSLKIVPGAANDDFADRTVIETNRVTAEPIWSTFERTEARPTNNPFAGSLWWKWTATASGSYRIQTLGGHQVARLEIFQGTSLTTLTRVAYAETDYPDATLVDFLAEAGTEYAISLSFTPAQISPIELEIHTPPNNDGFAAPLPLVLGETITNRVIAATLEPGETWLNNKGTLWYSWTAPSTGTFVFDAAGAMYDTDLHVFTGNELTNLTTVAAHRDFVTSTAIAFRAEAGTAYRFSVGLMLVPFEKIIRASIFPGHPNDDISNPSLLSGLFVSWTNTTYGSTLEQGEDPLSGNFFRASIWARWTAPETGRFRIIPQPYGDVEISVFRGNSLATLQKVSTAIPYSVFFDADAGTSYLLRIASSYDKMSSFIMRLGPVAPNETSTNAIELAGTNVQAIVHTWTLPHVQSVPSVPALWYKWTAPSHGLLSYSIPTNNNLLPRVLVTHLKRPTFDSNVVGYPARQWQSSPAINTIAVTEGVAYLFSVRSLPSTNLPLNLQFTEVPISLDSSGGYLLGGSSFWFSQTNVVFSGPDALQAGPLEPGEEAWIEMTFPGPGTVRYRSKYDGSFDGLTVATPIPGVGSLSSFRDAHDWTLRSLVVTGTTSVVRWTLSQSPYNSPAGTAWLDDIEFIPLPPRRPVLHLSIDSPSSLRLSLFLEANRTTAVDYTTNLLDWIEWTNIVSPYATVRSLQIPVSTDDMPQFFRARVEP